MAEGTVLDERLIFGGEALGVERIFVKDVELFDAVFLTPRVIVEIFAVVAAFVDFVFKEPNVFFGVVGLSEPVEGADDGAFFGEHVAFSEEGGEVFDFFFGVGGFLIGRNEELAVLSRDEIIVGRPVGGLKIWVEVGEGGAEFGGMGEGNFLYIFERDLESEGFRLDGMEGEVFGGDFLGGAVLEFYGRENFFSLGA